MASANRRCAAALEVSLGLVLLGAPVRLWAATEVRPRALTATQAHRAARTIYEGVVKGRLPMPATEGVDIRSEHGRGTTLHIFALPSGWKPLHRVGRITTTRSGAAKGFYLNDRGQRGELAGRPIGGEWILAQRTPPRTDRLPDPEPISYLYEVKSGELFLARRTDSGYLGQVNGGVQPGLSAEAVLRILPALRVGDVSYHQRNERVQDVFRREGIALFE
jgi:hypothetical protein